MPRNVNVVNLERAADLLGMGRSAAYQRARRGEFPGLLPIRGRYLVSLFEVERALGVPVGTLTTDMNEKPEEKPDEAA